MPEYTRTGRVDAADFGFLPGAPADGNAHALQAACDLGSTIVVDRPGVYDLCETIFLKSNTHLFFGPGVTLRRALAPDGTLHQSYVFVNRGAFSGVWDEDISIVGLHLTEGGLDSHAIRKKAAEMVVGLMADVSFFRARDITVRDFQLLDLGPQMFAIQICTFENAVLENIHIEGMKDAVHFGTGRRFVVRHGIFRTFDDPIALNAHDYSTSNPQLGWIEDGLIEDCYDLNQESTTGFFCRILAGSWTDWREGMVVQRSDTVVSEGRLYRVVCPPDGKTYVSRTRPTHEAGARDMDGFTWVMVQDNGPFYSCGCRNIHFRDIFLEKKRPVAFSIHFDHDNWSRSCYPGSPAPVQRDLIFENIFMNQDIPVLLTANTPAAGVKFINSVISNASVDMRALDVDGLDYGETDILFNGCTFRGDAPLLRCDEKHPASVRIAASLTENGYQPAAEGSVRVLGSDIDFK